MISVDAGVSVRRSDDERECYDMETKGGYDPRPSSADHGVVCLLPAGAVLARRSIGYLTKVVVVSNSHHTSCEFRSISLPHALSLDVTGRSLSAGGPIQ